VAPSETVGPTIPKAGSGLVVVRMVNAANSIVNIAFRALAMALGRLALDKDPISPGLKSEGTAGHLCKSNDLARTLKCLNQIVAYLFRSFGSIVQCRGGKEILWVYIANQFSICKGLWHLFLHHEARWC